MTQMSRQRHRFSPAVIQIAVWLYFRSTLSLREMEEMRVQRDVDVSCKTIRAWTVKFGPTIAANSALASNRPHHAGASTRWSARSAASVSSCDAQLMMKAKCSNALSRGVAIHEQR